MSIRILLLSAAVLIAASLAAIADDPEPPNQALKKLQGDWELVSMESKGKKSAKDTTANYRLSIKGDQWTVTVGQKVTMNSTIKLGSSKKPLAIDLINGLGNKKAAAASHGIYKLEGDTLTICRTVGSRERPKKFETTDKEGGLMVWKRVKK